MSKWVALLLLLAPIASFAACPTTVARDTACLDWTPPTTNTDGSTLTNLAGFKIYFSKSQLFTSGVSIVTINNPGQAHQNLNKLPAGTWYFRITAFNSEGRESAFSGTASKLIRIAAPTDGAIEAPTDGSIEPR